ncbi:cache domain-containing protein [Psychrobacillus sp. FJAT-51614]|uniref:Cache domain-containing protein n=1 Tax=Psychrobacillus mangrovi TaxID=3117745 RepID=A0ABU8EZV6_9BACI
MLFFGGNMKKTLRFWILTLITFSMVAILSSSLFSSYIVTKKTLIENSLEQNEVYSLKLSQMTEEVFESMQANLESRKLDVIHNMNDPRELTEILDQLLISGKNFNSLSVIGSDGIAIATSPNVGIVGNKIESQGVKEALNKRESIITTPYKAVTGRLVVLVSTPLFDSANNYLGMLNGSIYLQEDNFIQNILAEHFNEDGSYVFVVDKEGTLIYHPEKERIGEKVSENRVVQNLMEKESGSQEIYNTKGDHVIAGYTYIEGSEWGVVSQTPFDSSFESFKGNNIENVLLCLAFLNIFLYISVLYFRTFSFTIKKISFIYIKFSRRRYKYRKAKNLYMVF